MKTCIFLLRVFVNDVSLTGLVREQYEMAKKGIPWTESSLMSDFERSAIVSMIAEDYKLEAEQYKLDK